jgi:hypothetical protein
MRNPARLGLLLVSALLLCACDARLFQSKSRVRFPGKLVRPARPSARANNAHMIPKYIRTTAKLAGLDVLTILGNYICTLAAPLAVYSGNQYTRGYVALSIFATEFHPGDDYNVALISQFANADRVPPDNGTILRYQIKNVTDNSSLVHDLSSIGYQDVSDTVNGAIKYVLTFAPFLSGVLPSTDLYRYVAATSWTHTKDMQRTDGPGTYTDLVTDMIQNPTNYYARLAAGGNEAVGTFYTQ